MQRQPAVIGSGWRTAAGAICLLLSGAGALFYELVWSHQFSIVFGSSEIATASVLGIYLAGLGFGAAIALRRCRTSRRPLKVYALLEITIALSALFVPVGLRWSQGIFYRVAATDALPAASFGGSWFWQLAITAVLLSVPTLGLGASFPYAVRGLVLDDRTASRATAWLYSANTLGAVTGSLVAGIFILPALGIRLSTWTGATLSLTAAALALVVERYAQGEQSVTTAAEEASAGRFPFVPVVTLAGAVSLASQILWTRLLIHFVGSGLYALSILLAAFLLGLTLGSAIAGIVGTRARYNAIGFAAAQMLLAACSWVAFTMLDRWVAAGPPAATAFEDRLARGAAIAALTLLPMAAASGAAFLFAINARARSAEAAAPTVASAYQWTAVGNLAGGVVLALIVFPRLGFGRSQELLIALSLTAAALAAWTTAQRRLLLASLGILAAALVLLPLPDAFSVLMFSPLTGASDPDGVVFAALGTSASVVLTEEQGQWSLRTNGLREGTIQPPGVSPSRDPVPRWLGLLPFLARPEARSALVVGLGAGTTAESIPRSVDRVAVVEIEHQVVAANRSVSARRRGDPLSDPRLELVINDARDVLNRTQQRFDVVVSQPSHPWTAGSANLYTREFFTSVSARLESGGIFAQWLGLPFVDEPLLRSVLATLASVFNHVEVYRPPPGAALIFLASNNPIEPRLAPSLRHELTALGIWRPEDVASRWVLSTTGVRQAALGAEPITDDRNLLASGSPRILGRGLARSRGEGVLAGHDPLMADHAQLDRLALVERLWIPERIARIASVEPDSTRRQLALTWLPAAEARRSRPLLLASALETEPEDLHLRSLALVEAKASIAQGGPVPSALRELSAAEGWIVEGWRAVAAGEWAAVERLEGPLAGLEPASPLFWEGLSLRGQWRVASAQAAHHAQALTIFDSMLSHRADPAVLLLYAIAADRAGLTEGTLAALSDLARVPASERPAAVERAARALLRTHSFPAKHASWVQAIDRRLAP